MTSIKKMRYFPSLYTPVGSKGNRPLSPRPAVRATFQNPAPPGPSPALPPLPPPTGDKRVPLPRKRPSFGSGPVKTYSRVLFAAAIFSRHSIRDGLVTPHSTGNFNYLLWPVRYSRMINASRPIIALPILLHARRDDDLVLVGVGRSRSSIGFRDGRWGSTELKWAQLGRAIIRESAAKRIIKWQLEDRHPSE